VAQLGARLDGIEEVVGSNPIGSTRLKLSLVTPLFFSLSQYLSLANCFTPPLHMPVIL
jgi:hypothetical protein